MMVFGLRDRGAVGWASWAAGRAGEGLELEGEGDVEVGEEEVAEKVSFRSNKRAPVPGTFFGESF
jgi:hypothetical protein